jgi:hypothetical protein
MALLKAAVEADVPIRFADEVWSEFIRRSTYGSYAKGFADVAAALSEIDAEDGTVTFETATDRLVRVSVELEYVPRAGGGAAAEIARAQTVLEHDLENYRVFLMRRWDQETSR